jgi:hypothetical protein
VKSLETVGVYDEGTAYRILLWKAIAFQCSRSILRYSCVQEYAFLTPGSLVWLSDSLLQLERAAWVQSVDLATDGRVELELVTWGAECQ